MGIDHCMFAELNGMGYSWPPLVQVDEILALAPRTRSTHERSENR